MASRTKKEHAQMYNIMQKHASVSGTLSGQRITLFKIYSRLDLQLLLWRHNLPSCNFHTLVLLFPCKTNKQKILFHIMILQVLDNMSLFPKLIHPWSLVNAPDGRVSFSSYLTKRHETWGSQIKGIGHNIL